MGRRARRLAELELGSEAAAVLADQRCRCGAVLEGKSALTIHADSGCDRPEAYGQLVQLGDGRWGQRSRHPEAR
jgi:hypothetical protein